MNIIVKPLISEKMTRITEAAASPKLNKIQRDKNKPAPKVLNRYGFVVDKRANKIEIKKAVEAFYGVKVLDVNTMNYAGRLVTWWVALTLSRRPLLLWPKATRLTSTQASKQYAVEGMRLTSPCLQQVQINNKQRINNSNSPLTRD